MKGERKRSNGNVMITVVMMMICMNMCMMIKGAQVPSPPPKCSTAWCYAKCAGQCVPWAGPFCPLICYKSCQDRCHYEIPKFVCQFRCLSARCPQLKQPNSDEKVVKRCLDECEGSCDNQNAPTLPPSP